VVHFVEIDAALQNGIKVKDNHKFKVGQMVELSTIRGSIPPSNRAYKIVRLLPSDGTELLYRIKSGEEAFERVARESHLTRAKTF
jgi:hypothetical protein